MHEQLVLFDIDGTLIDTRGAGLRAIRRAVHDLHGLEGPELDLNGATDAGLAHQILLSFGRQPDDASLAAFYEAYLVRLDEQLTDAEFAGVMLPGVCDLLDALRAAGAVLGLLTGNMSAGAEMKMRRFGLWEYFEFGAYGDDHPNRNELGPIALERAAKVHRRAFVASKTVVVGDTPKDIACGHAFGARTVAVATGCFGEDELRAHNPFLVVRRFDNPALILNQLQGDQIMEID